jgi:hypothetical protein
MMTDDRTYFIRISPQNIKNKIFPVDWVGSEYSVPKDLDPCCPITGATATTYNTTGITYVYSSMTDIVSGGTNGNSLLTDLSIPIMFTENTVDLGYYSPVDGGIIQKDLINNFIVSADTINPFEFYFYNTSDVTFLKYVTLITYQVDWGDGTPLQTITNFVPSANSHTYVGAGTFTLKLYGTTPWGTTLTEKEITVPFSNVSIPNLSGTTTFIPAGGSWSATSLSYDYIYDYDGNNSVYYQASSGYTSVPFPVTGYSESTINDLEQYGSSKYPPVGITVTGNSGVVGTYYGISPDGLYKSYTINGVDYFDYDNFTVYSVSSSGLTSNEIGSDLLVKNEMLLNMVMEPEVQSDIYVERGKNSALERVQRLGEVGSLNELVDYGYGFFNIINIT